MVLCRKGCPLGPGVVSTDQANVQSTHGTCALPEASEVPGAPGTTGHGCWPHTWSCAASTDTRCHQPLRNAAGHSLHTTECTIHLGKGVKVATQTQKMSMFPFSCPDWAVISGSHTQTLLAVLIYENTSIWTQRLTRISVVQKEPKSGSLSLSLFSRGPRKHRVPWGQP